MWIFGKIEDICPSVIHSPNRKVIFLQVCVGLLRSTLRVQRRQHSQYRTQKSFVFKMCTRDYALSLLILEDLWRKRKTANFYSDLLLKNINLEISQFFFYHALRPFKAKLKISEMDFRRSGLEFFWLSISLILGDFSLAFDSFRYFAVPPKNPEYLWSWGRCGRVGKASFQNLSFTNSGDCWKNKQASKD